MYWQKWTKCAVVVEQLSLNIKFEFLVSHLTFSEPVQLSVESMIISIYVRLAANSQVDSNYGYNNEAII